jgi:hypothetical protein
MNIRHQPVLLYAIRLSALVLILATNILLVPSCKKDNVTEPTPSVDTLLVLAFNDATIPEGLYDSAYVVLQRKGTTIPYILRFQKVGDELQADIDGLRKGEYTARINLYAGVSGSNEKREYHRTIDLQLGSNTGRAYVTGPNGSLGDDWEPRIVLSYNNEIKFFVSLNFAHPYFRVEAADPSKWARIQLQRTANNKIPGTGTELLASQTWSCTTNCFQANTNTVENGSTFVELAEKLKTKTWNHGEIDIIVESKNGTKTEDYIYYHR